MASAATNLFEAELVIDQSVGVGCDKAGRSTQIFSKAFPVTLFAANIRIDSIGRYTTTTNGIFLEIKEFRIRHPIHNLTH